MNQTKTIQLQLRRDIFGWNKDDNKTIEYEPPYHGPCIVCCRALEEPLVKSTVIHPRTKRCYFYRSHKKCWELVSKRERALYDKCLLDLLNKGAL